MGVEIREISKWDSMRMVVRYHYSDVIPRLTKYWLGGFEDGELKATLTLGWGVRPIHTIRKLFPSLGTPDYYEIGKMCIAPDVGFKGTQFMGAIFDWAKAHLSIKLIYTWADGMLGKPGFIYQASNFLYGGFIWTDCYFYPDGRRLHPRQSRQFTGTSRRPTKDDVISGRIQHFKGKQFRYCYPICNRGQKRTLLKNSTVEWTTNYPKREDLKWKKLTTGGWVDSPMPNYDKSFRNHPEFLEQERLTTT